MISFFLTLIVGFLLLLIFYFIERSKGLPRRRFIFFGEPVTEEKPVKLPPSMDKTFLGLTDSKRKVYIPNDAKHVFVCGTTGSGKTIALSNFIKSGIDYDYPLLLIDGKGDTGENSMLDITKKLSNDRKLYVIDLNNPEASDKYNPFRNTSADIIKDMLINMTTWSEDHYKYNTERYVQKLSGMLNKLDIIISLDSLIKYLPLDNFLTLSKKLASEKLITKEEHAENMEIAKASGKIAESACARFATIKESRLGQIFSDDGIDIYTALNENAIILFILNPLLYSETSPLVGKLIVIDSKKAVSLFYQNKKKRIFYIMDEINTYASSTFVDLVNKSRSANITCILATQSLSDLDEGGGEYFKEQIIENCNNYILLRQNSPKNAETWAKIFGTRETMKYTSKIDDGGITSDGTARKVHEYLYHPDMIKRLSVGKAIFLSRDKDYHTKLNINKPF